MRISRMLRLIQTSAVVLVVLVATVVGVRTVLMEREIRQNQAANTITHHAYRLAAITRQQALMTPDKDLGPQWQAAVEGVQQAIRDGGFDGDEAPMIQVIEQLMAEAEHLYGRITSLSRGTAGGVFLGASVPEFVPLYDALQGRYEAVGEQALRISSWNHRQIDTIRLYSNLATLAVILGMACYLILSSRLLARHISRPLAALAEGMEQVTGGDLTRRIEIRVDNELGDLAGSFNDMVASRRAAEEKAERAGRVKSDFLASMSHEIRTPLNAVLGMTRLCLMENPEPKVVRDYLGLAEQSGRNLLALLNDVLDLSKIEAGKVELERVRFDLRQLLDDSLGPLEAVARDKGLSMAWRVHPSVPCSLRGDPDRLRQVLTNLVGNAAKYTLSGGIEVTAEPGGEWTGQEGACMLFRVRDSGVGIPEDRLATIFESFTQALHARELEQGGTGLGLTISRELVRMMGGSIAVESTPGRGSTFSFSVVLGQADGTGPEMAPRRGQIEGIPLRILVAEDNDINALLAESLLGKRGHSTARARDGLEALEMLAREEFDLVFMDIRMPRLDGTEATARIRAGQPGVDPGIPIVAVTASALQGDRERFLQSGMDDYLPKPIDLEELDRLLERIMSARYDAGHE